MNNTGPLHPLDRVTAVIVNFNSGRWLGRCVRSLRDHGAGRPPVLVIDNASDDGSVEELPALPGIRVRRAHGNLGFGRGVNQALRTIRTEYLLIINPDCLILPAAIERLIEELEACPEAAMVSGRVFDMRGSEQRGSRRRLPTRRHVLAEINPLVGHNGIDLTADPAPDGPIEVEAVSGACMLMRTQVLRDLGGFDPDFYLHFEDLDLMARLAQHGWRIRLVPSVFISHAGGVSSRQRPVLVMLNKHRGLWRYLRKHCAGEWAFWNRALWWLMIVVHAACMVPVTLVRRR